MSDITTEIPAPPAADARKGGALTTAKVRRRMEQINAATDERKARKRRNAMGMRLLRQIASGKVKNPAAAARAFVEALPEKAEPAPAGDTV